MDTRQNRIGSGCQELRILDGDVIWRIVYAVEGDAVVILDALPKDSAARDGSVVGAVC
jgi:phage-related protein